MPILRPSLALGALLIALSACTNSDHSITAPVPSEQSALTLNALTGDATIGHPMDAWMGDTLAHVLRVRVTDRNGHAAAGVAVRFTESGGATRDALSDNTGIADAGSWAMHAYDTVTAVQTVTASLIGRESSSVVFAARAFRDLTRFGGTGALVLRALPISRADLQAILPMGTFGTEDALPSADAMLLPRTHGAYPVRAMSDGVIVALDASTGMVTMRVRDGIRIRIAGMTLKPSLWLGHVVRAGDELGAFQATASRAGLAVRLMDATISPGAWLSPDRYGARTTTAFFVRYLADSVRSHAYAMVRRAAPDLEGRINYDQVGRLIGTWFDASAPAVSSPTLASEIANSSPFASVRVTELDPSADLAPIALTFAYDAERPGQVRIALGRGLLASLGMNGVRATGWEDPDPANVGVGSGIVRYSLYSTDDEARIGRPDRTLLVQLIDAETLRVEVVSAPTTSNARFSARAVTLIR